MGAGKVRDLRVGIKLKNHRKEKKWADNDFNKILLGLVFFNPLYFLIMTLSNILNRKLLAVFILSATLGPLLNYLSPSWGVLIAGFISGSLGFFYFRIKNDR